MQNTSTIVEKKDGKTARQWLETLDRKSLQFVAASINLKRRTTMKKEELVHELAIKPVWRVVKPKVFETIANNKKEKEETKRVRDADLDKFLEGLRVGDSVSETLMVHCKIQTGDYGFDMEETYRNLTVVALKSPTIILCRDESGQELKYKWFGSSKGFYRDCPESGPRNGLGWCMYSHMCLNRL